MKFLIVILASVLALEAQAATNEKIVFCYYGSWAVYRQGNGMFRAQDIDATMCTHVGYTFFGVNDDGSVKSLDTWADYPDGKNGLGQLEALKKINPKLKTILVVGGWNERATKYSNIAKDPVKMKKFIDTLLELMIKFKFNGFDLDWEYPAHLDQGGDASVDKKNFVTFVKMIKAALAPKGYSFSAAVAAPETTASNAYNIPEVCKELDFINVMTYDLHGNWDKKTGLHTTLDDPSNPKLSVRGTIDYWIKAGCPANKLILGIGTYGQSFTLADPKNNGINAAAPSPGAAGPYTKQNGFLGYNEICEKLKTDKWTEVFSDSNGAPYAYKGNQWVGYDNVKSVGLKMDMALQKGLGGAMIWSIETDDFKGVCGEVFPLLRAINRGLKKDVPPAPPTVPTLPTTKPVEVVTKPPNNGGSTGGSSITCPDAGVQPNSADRNTFYLCSAAGAVGTLMTCPAGLVFDAASKTCTWG